MRTRSAGGGIARRPDRGRPAARAGAALRVGPLYASFARQRIDRAAFAALFDFARERDFAGALRRLFDGEPVNATEGRAACIPRLRSDLSTAASRATRTPRPCRRERMAGWSPGSKPAASPTSSASGSAGPTSARLAVDDALAAPDARFRLHFLSNVDGHAAHRWPGSIPRTAAILISRPSAPRTLLNGGIVRAWLGDDSRLFAVSATSTRGRVRHRARTHPADVGLGRRTLLAVVGGRVPGRARHRHGEFRTPLAGAAAMDAHAAQAPLERNLAAWHALAAVWNRNALGAATQAVLPYDERLKLLPNYLQQLVMESLSKSVRVDGGALAADTVPVWWGGAGTDPSTASSRPCTRGAQVVPADFVGVVRGDHPHAGNHAALLGQPAGPDRGAGERPGQRRPASRLPAAAEHAAAARCADPETLGMLVAMYEHSVYLQSVAWGINAFDQFGVELGKAGRNRLLPALRGRSRSRRCGDEGVVARDRIPFVGATGRSPRPGFALSCRASAHSTCSRTTGDPRAAIATPTRLPAWSAHCPAPPRCCAASARARCGGSPNLRCATQEFAFAPREQIDQGRLVEAVARAEIRLVAAPRELVPRAGELAVVATEDAIADQRRRSRRCCLRARWSGS